MESIALSRETGFLPFHYEDWPYSLQCNFNFDIFDNKWNVTHNFVHNEKSNCES